MKRPSKKPLKISEEQIRWAMCEAITDYGKTQREYIADYYRCGPGERQFVLYKKQHDHLFDCLLEMLNPMIPSFKFSKQIKASRRKGKFLLI